MNDCKIAFIICTNDEIMIKECRLYIERLFVPKGYKTEILEIYDAVSMASGYNAGMKQTDARYKIYMHQDVFILNRYFLVNMLKAFQLYPSAKMMGMVGTERLSATGIMWKGKSYGALYERDERPYIHKMLDEETKVMKAEAIDGFLMATCEDLPWREDLFDGFDFYDISQSFEFHRHGYEIAVPDQEYAWCVHDDGKILNLFHYNYYREIFLENYREDMAAVDRKTAD